MNHFNIQKPVRDRRRLVLALTALGLAGAIAVNRALVHGPGFSPVLAKLKWLPLRCPLNFLTGLECPLCGLGRSVLALAYGDLSAAWQFNPAGPTLVAVALSLLFSYVLSPVRFSLSICFLKTFWRSLHPSWKYLGLSLYLLVFVLRNL